MTSTYDIRSSVADDAPFIIQSWLRHQKGLLVGAERREGVGELFGEVIATLLPSSEVYVAVAPGWLRDEGVAAPERLIRGYIVAEPGDEVPDGVSGKALADYRPTLIHMTYVKLDYRGNGIGRALMDKVIADRRNVVCTTLARGWPNEYIRTNRWSRAHRLPWARTLQSVSRATENDHG